MLIKINAIKKFWPIGLAALFLLFAGILAITQEADVSLDADDESVIDEFPLDDMLADFSDDEEIEGWLPSEWEPFGPPRWFRSNAGGMMLEEIPSRLAALRHKHALVIDYIPPDEMEPMLRRYYRNDYIIEVRILYENKQETRRQWLFRDESGVARLNAVLKPLIKKQPKEQLEETDELPAPINHDTAKSRGFIELFDENSNITEERQYFDDESETLIIYTHNNNILITAEAQERRAGERFQISYIDHYRYNRSYSLRYVEREYFGDSYLQPIRLTFPGRVMDAALDENFISDKLTVTSDFFGVPSVNKGYRMIYNTDNRGRVLTQTLLNEKNEKVWEIANTWSGDRIVSMKKTEGKDVKVTEYEYNREGKRIVQRDIHNGVLERLVRINGTNETEELYLDGNLVMKAFWENGKKVSEERVRVRRR